MRHARLVLHPCFRRRISTPSRAAEWVLRLKKQEHEFVATDFGSA
ncbi:hypothetical protein PF006_g22074, partial [Phytophthora fragariae]